MTSAAQPANATDVPLLLEVEINGFSTSKVGEFVVRDGVLMARPSELRDLGVSVSVMTTDLPIAISGIAGVGVRLEEATQKLHLSAPAAALIPASLTIDTEATAAAAAIMVTSGTGATFDYDINGTAGGGTGDRVGGLFNARVFAPWGVISSGALVRAFGSTPYRDGGRVTRLESSYTYSDVARRRRYRVGDFVTGSVAWSQSVRLAGLQIISDFSTRPDLVTFPLPSVSGAAAVPSTVDVVVNGARLYSGQVGAGPFEIPRLPVISGAGTIALTVTDPLGRQIVTDLQFYASATQLAPGLQTYSAQVGAVRRSFGTLSSDYGRVAAIGNYRRGLSQWLTVEGSAEATRGTLVAGAGAVINAGDIAQVNVAIAASTGANGTGTQISAGVQRIGAVFNFGASATLANRDFRDVASASGDAITRLRLGANAGVSLGRLGTLGIAYAGIERDAATRPNDVIGPIFPVPSARPPEFDAIDYFEPPQRAHIVTVNYSAQIGTIALFATAYRDFANRNSTGVVVGLTMPLGRRGSAAINGGAGSGGRYGQLQVTRSISAIGDWGYQAFASAGETSHKFGQVQYKAPWSLLTAGIDRNGRDTVARGGLQGSISFLDGGVFASNTITDSFAVVDTNGLAGVRVLQENRPAGRTNAAGQVLVPELRAFDLNRLAIDPSDIPLDTMIAQTSLSIRPADRSGVVARFTVKVSRGALLTLVDAAGVPTPIGSTATLASSGIVVPIGYDGAAYVEDLDAANIVTVERSDGRRCTVAFAYIPAVGEIPRIGPLTCIEPMR